MALVAAFVLAWIATAAYAVSRSLVYPAVLFCGAWALSLFAILLAGDMFYPVSEKAALVFLVGGLSFSFGSFLALAHARWRRWCAEPFHRAVEDVRCARLVLDLLLILVVGGLPYYWTQVRAITGDVEGGLLFSAVRNALVEGETENLLGPIAGNLHVLAGILAPALVYETDGSWNRRWRVIVAVLAALTYATLAGSKGGVVVLLTVLFTYWTKSARIPFASMIAAGIGAVVFFGAALFLINLAGSHQDGQSTPALIASIILNYWVGGLVAFGEVIESPISYESTQHVGRFFVSVARSLGFSVEVPSVHAVYTVISDRPEIMDTNTYTIYFSYFKDLGWFGTTAILIALGYVLTLVWRKALLGAPMSTVFYGAFATASVLSFFSEQFLLGLNGYLKALLVYFAVFHLAPAFLRRVRRPGGLCG